MRQSTCKAGAGRAEADAGEEDGENQTAILPKQSPPLTFELGEQAEGLGVVGVGVGVGGEEIK